MSIVWVTSLLKPSLVLISATTTVGKLHSFVGWVGWLALWSGLVVGLLPSILLLSGFVCFDCWLVGGWLKVMEFVSTEEKG